MQDINAAVLKFWDDRPCNIRHSDKPVGTKEYFEEVTRRKYFVEGHILELANFEAYLGKSVLEVGRGIGTAARSFMEAGADYTGIDVSPKSIELAQVRAKLFGLSGEISPLIFSRLTCLTRSLISSTASEFFITSPTLAPL